MAIILTMMEQNLFQDIFHSVKYFNLVYELLEQIIYHYIYTTNTSPIYLQLLSMLHFNKRATPNIHILLNTKLNINRLLL
jgi:hypothetical protein